MTPENGILADQVIQWGADRMKILKSGLRNRDPETVRAVLDQIAEKYGFDEERVNQFLDDTVWDMVEEEGFGWMDR